MSPKPSVTQSYQFGPLALTSDNAELLLQDLDTIREAAANSGYEIEPLKSWGQREPSAKGEAV